MLTLTWCSFHPRVTATARKRPRSFCQSADGRLHQNTHTPLIQRSRSGLTKPMSRHSVETYPETSSHATCHGTFSELIHFKKKKKKKRRRGMNSRTSPLNPRKRGKTHRHSPVTCVERGYFIIPKVFRRVIGRSYSKTARGGGETGGDPKQRRQLD